MCTDKKIAWQSTIDRYNEMKKHGQTPRAVPRDKYNEMVKAIPFNISLLYNSGKFDDIYLFNRNEQCLYHFKEQPNQDPSKIVRKALNGRLNLLSSKLTKSFSVNLDSFANKVHSENTAKLQQQTPSNLKQSGNTKQPPKGTKR